MKRWLQKITLIHRVHHRNFSYGYVFMPFMIGYFPMYWKVYEKQRSSPWHRVQSEHFHDCTATNIY
jgi:hypothetical protein